MSCADTTNVVDMLGVAQKPADVELALKYIVADTFRQENTRRQEDRDPTRLTMSGLGGCTRANAYAIAGTPPSDVHGPEQARQALLGTGAHDWFLPAMARTLGRLGVAAQVEKRVTLRAAGLEIHGTLDLAFGQVVADLKTLREWRLGGVRRTGAEYAEHRVQVLGYALSEYQAGRDVRWVPWIYMDRATGEEEIVVGEFTNAAALDVIRRVEAIKAFARDPDSAPREARGPGVSPVCDRCPWLRRCWGPDAVPGQPGAQVVAAGDWEGLMHILELYANAAAAGSEAERDKDFAKLVLAHTKAGTYGGFKLSRGRPGERDDIDGMRSLLTDLGIAVPRKAVAGQTRVTRVTR